MMTKMLLLLHLAIVALCMTNATAESLMQNEAAYLQEELTSMIRVDHAGERSAVEIYNGQLWMLNFLHNPSEEHRKAIEHMRDQETVHRDGFVKLMAAYEIQESIVNPVWDYLAFGLGAASSVFGIPGAMLCTVGVEESIIDHYNEQIAFLNDNEDLASRHTWLLNMLIKNRDEENEHRVTGLEERARDGPFIINVIAKLACQVGLFVSKRI